MKHRKVIGIILAAVVLACLAAVPVTAQALPCQFKGTVTLDDSPVLPGTPIMATLTDGTPVLTVYTYIDGMDSRYNMIIPEEVDTIVLTEGTVLDFYVDGYFGGTDTWNGGATKTLNLAAYTQLWPEISVPTSISFGDVTVWTCKTKTLTISNVGYAVLDIDDITITGPDAGQFWVGTYPGTIAAGGSANVDVDFCPTSTGYKSATLTIYSNDPWEPEADVALSGTGVIAPPPGEGFAWWLYETFIEDLV